VGVELAQGEWRKYMVTLRRAQGERE